MPKRMPGALVLLGLLSAGCSTPDAPAEVAGAATTADMDLESLLKRAEQGDAQAQTDLGFRYRTGQGVPQDYVEMVRWYRLAAEQGHADALYGLGRSYDNGDGVPQDYVEAHKWFNLSAARGGAFAPSMRDTLPMSAAQIAEAQRLATEWQVAFDRRQTEEGP